MSAEGRQNAKRAGCLHLAAGAVPRSASRNARLLDRLAAPRTRLVFPAVHAELGLHGALGAVGRPIVAKRGALSRDPEPKRAPNASYEGRELLRRELVSGS